MTFEGEPVIDAATEMTLKMLTDDELESLRNFLSWGGSEDKVGDALKKGNPALFTKVKQLFTENNGQNVHSLTRAAISRAVNKRL